MPSGAPPAGDRVGHRRRALAENLAAARAYFAEAGTLAAPRHATALDRPVGQWLTNIRRPGGCW
ncbi:Helicase associated domain protein [Streptomyces sp. NPDC094438]|uniref:Helicase associated domain protein n=1 Tax=Streptomyces sp. NPDC094438 TaxID=3366061 RepID=UPI0038222412